MESKSQFPNLIREYIQLFCEHLRGSLADFGEKHHNNQKLSKLWRTWGT